MAEDPAAHNTPTSEGGRPPPRKKTETPAPRPPLVELPKDEYAHAMRQRYASGVTPWDTGRPSDELVRVLDSGLLPGRTVLELGCGTGTNSLEFARRGYQVTAVDVVDLPVARARDKAQRAGLRVDFRVGDLTELDLGGPYDVLFDLGLYHGIRRRNLVAFLETLRRVTRPGTRWLSLAGNARETLEEGPPVVSEVEFRSELGPLFRFVDVREFRMDLAPGFQPLAWSILMERL